MATPRQINASQNYEPFRLIEIMKYEVDKINTLSYVCEKGGNYVIHVGMPQNVAEFLCNTLNENERLKKENKQLLLQRAKMLNTIMP